MVRNNLDTASIFGQVGDVVICNYLDLSSKTNQVLCKFYEADQCGASFMKTGPADQCGAVL